jgi:hypothetical protein
MGRRPCQWHSGEMLAASCDLDVGLRGAGPLYARAVGKIPL